MWNYGWLLGLILLWGGPASAAPPSTENEADAEETEDPSKIPSWRSFDQWLNRSGLKLSDEQLKNLDDLRKKVEQNSPSSKLDDGAPEAENPTTNSRDQQASWQAYQAGLSKILTPEQLQRIRKQWFQFRGMTVLGDEQVAEKLKLTDDQKRLVDESLEDFRSRRQALIQETKKTGKAGRQRRREGVSKLREVRDRKLDDLLTKEQKDAFAKLGDVEEESEAMIQAPKLSDDFIELGPSTKLPPGKDD